MKWGWALQTHHAANTNTNKQTKKNTHVAENIKSCSFVLKWISVSSSHQLFTDEREKRPVCKHLNPARIMYGPERNWRHVNSSPMLCGLVPDYRAAEPPHLILGTKVVQLTFDIMTLRCINTTKWNFYQLSFVSFLPTHQGQNKSFCWCRFPSKWLNTSMKPKTKHDFRTHWRTNRWELRFLCGVSVCVQVETRPSYIYMRM